MKTVKQNAQTLEQKHEVNSMLPCSKWLGGGKKGHITPTPSCIFGWQDASQVSAVLAWVEYYIMKNMAAKNLHLISVLGNPDFVLVGAVKFVEATGQKFF